LRNKPFAAYILNYEPDKYVSVIVTILLHSLSILCVLEGLGRAWSEVWAWRRQRILPSRMPFPTHLSGCNHTLTPTRPVLRTSKARITCGLLALWAKGGDYFPVLVRLRDRRHGLLPLSTAQHFLAEAAHDYTIIFRLGLPMIHPFFLSSFGHGPLVHTTGFHLRRSFRIRSECHTRDKHFYPLIAE
jgi:hypothetical protein